MRGKVAIVILAVVATALLTVGAGMILSDRRAAEEYRAVAAEFGPSRESGDSSAEHLDVSGSAEAHGDGSMPASADWPGLTDANGSVAAWLTVEGTTVDMAVVQATPDDPDAWLYRDLWGKRSDAGAPYLDHRCSPYAEAAVVYGHRTTYESYLFHDLSPLYEQERFDESGPAVWDTPDEGPIVFEPLCAASVDMAAEGWQASDVVDGLDLRLWLRWACEQASATAADSASLIEEARRALILVTCNGRAFYPETRTVVVYVSPELPGDAAEGGTD